MEYDEEYFSDMMFRDGSIVARYLKYKIEDRDNHSMRNCCYDVPVELTDISENYYRFLIEPSDERPACVRDEKRIVTFTPEHSQDKTTILHELIHVHEKMLNRGLAMFREALFLSLYNHLKEKVNELDERILCHAHFIPGENITREGGSHGILFYLKSLELDIRCGLELGTICGYGRDVPLDSGG
jgi:hypothetical protein